MLTDMFRPLDGMPAGTTLIAKVAPAGKRPNKTPIFASGASDTRGFLTWLRTQCPSSLSAQLKAEKLMIVPETADGFRATVSVLRFLDGNKGVSFQTFSLPEDRQVSLLINNLGRQMPESVVREELEALGICVQGVMQLGSGRRNLDASKDRPLTPHFIVSVARGPGVQKVRSLSEICGLRVSVETYVAPKGPVQCKRCQRIGHLQGICGYAPRCVTCGETNLSGGCSTPNSSLNAAAAVASTRPTTGAAASGKRQKRRLQSKCPTNAPRPAVMPSSPAQTEWSRHSHPQSRRALDLVGTMLSEEVVFLRLPSQPFLNQLQHRSQGPSKVKNDRA
jgi:hypothetical protein